MVCPVIIMDGDKESRRVGRSAHVDGEGNVDLSAYSKSILEDKFVK